MKQVAQWATIAYLGASMMLDHTIIYESQKHVTPNLKSDQELIQKHNCNDIMPVRKEEGKSYWKIPLCDDDATREK